MEIKKIDEVMDLIAKGENICFTFKHEAEEYALRNKLSIKYNDGEFVDDPHYDIKGYKGKLYWIAY